MGRTQPGNRRAHRPQRHRIQPETRQTPLGDRTIHARLFGYYRPSIRYERYANHFCAVLTLACFKKLTRPTT
jgi:hypothetical protein